MTAEPLRRDTYSFPFGGWEWLAETKLDGWQPIPSWGQNGWDLGSWPIVCVAHRDETPDTLFRVAEYVEGDVTVEAYRTREERDARTDEIAEQWWRHDGASWVEPYPPGELPAELRGPFTRARLDEASRTPAPATRTCACPDGPRSTRDGRCIDCGETPAGEPLLGDLGHCRACRKPILWAVTDLGRKMPVDREPSPTGNVLLVPIGGGPAAGARVLAGDDLDRARAAGETLRLPHHATCPEGERFRRRRRARRS